MELSNFQRYSIDLDATEITGKSKRQLAGLHKLALEGNAKAWEDLWLYGTKLVLKIVNKLHSLDLLSCSFEDAVAEGNLAIGEALTRWNPKKAGFSTWVWIRVRGAVQNASNRELSKEINETDFGVDAVNREGEDIFLDGSALLESGSENPADSMDYARLYESMVNLPEREYELVVLHYFEDVSQTEIASMLGISQPMVHKILRRAEERLKLFFEDGL